MANLKSTVVNTSTTFTIPPGSVYYAILNTGAADGLVDGVILEPKVYQDVPFLQDDGYGQVLVDGTGTTLKVQSVFKI
jgi:hypothetical protein